MWTLEVHSKQRHSKTAALLLYCAMVGSRLISSNVILHCTVHVQPYNTTICLLLNHTLAFPGNFAT